MSQTQPQDYPELALSDIMHLMSPPPHDEETPYDFQAIRKRALEMSSSPQPPTTANKELLDMVMRLTDTIPPDPDQLIRQAELISGLAEQRDFLMRQAEEQHLRWDAEREGWARMAEALIAQQTRNRGSADREEELDRQNSIIEADNKTLRSKLNETQSRLTLLETELTRLRPLLLMQSANMSALPKQSSRRRGKDREAPPFIDEDHDGYVSPCNDEDTTPQTTPRHRHSRHSTTNPKKKPTSAAQKNSSRPISADARTEHLLLAARKIGKQRTGLMAGFVSHLQYKGKDKDRDEVLTVTPNTPRRSYPYLNTISPVRNPPPGAPIPAPILLPAYSSNLLQTPSSSSSTTVPPSSSSRRHLRNPEPRPTSPRTQHNPPTPLDSLLSAARSAAQSMMIDEEDRESTASPLPKRRKLDASVSSSLNPATTSLSTLREREGDPGGARIRSALDVLADQAAVFSSQEAQEKIQTQPQSQLQEKDKGKGKSRTRPSPEMPAKEKSKLRTRPKRKTAESTRLSRTPTQTPSQEPIHLSPRPPPAGDWESGLGPTNLRPVQWNDGGNSDEALSDDPDRPAEPARQPFDTSVNGSSNAEVHDPTAGSVEVSSKPSDPPVAQDIDVDAVIPAPTFG
ncbi:hypothetical protein BJ138DRAFT_206357 [Hygrophoropsis aurantiaca]|uniref:Uncharacterized protein n=1 Tax=Hygrophoropsis aurantiaca TaxID=72124 RepID=A0ACB8A8S8_9AGAM|nr:hypothetical protein BJ138DRAFT_206357 [Hygrophoropsis aurantiaca]